MQKIGQIRPEPAAATLRVDGRGPGWISRLQGRTLASMVTELSFTTPGPGLTEITREVESVVAASGVLEGVCTVFVQHTSASLTIQENADPSARHDLERWLARLVPEGDAEFTHTAEGPDDMPSHIRAALTDTSLSIPVLRGAMALGRWQGIYLWEHRRRGRERRVIVHVG